MAAKKRRSATRRAPVRKAQQNNSKILALLAILAVLIVGYYFMNASNQMSQVEESMESTPWVITLSEQNNSKQPGTATLTEVDGKVVVTVETQYAPMGVSQPAHIHIGPCATIGKIVYPLTNLVDGKSVTTIDATLDELEVQKPLALNVHKSVAQANVYTSCGDL